MARKRSKVRQQEEFIKAVLGLAGLGSFFVTYWLTKSFQIAVTVAFVAVGIVIGILIIRHLDRVERLKKSGIADIDKMEGIQFEKYLSHLLKVQGYQTQVTRAAGDYGADLIITKDGKKTVVQAKRHSANVGIKAVQEAQASIAHYGASDAWVITNRDYTEAAIELAKSNRVRLINRQELIDMILKMNPGTVPSASKVLQETPVQVKNCTRCGSKMVMRKGPKGKFYGCSSFPKCRNVVEAQ